jgi:cytochrome P450
MTVLHLLFGVLLLPLAFVAWTTACLARNHRAAKSTGLTIVVHIVSDGSPLWMLFSPLVVRVASYLPFTSTFIATYRRGWEARERSRLHTQFGDLFMLVTPSGNTLRVCNPQVTSDILKRNTDFKRDMESFEVLNIYGKNLATTEGHDWNRHRKVATVTFTEKNNELVWRESLKEGQQMLEYWVKRAPKPIRTLAQDARIFTLNVLAAALFDKSYPFEGREESLRRERSEGGVKSTAFAYRDSLSTILTMIVPILIFGEKRLKEAWWLPSFMRKAGFAVQDFRDYVTRLIDEERVLISQGKSNTPNLVTNLVRACDELAKDVNITPEADYSGPRRAILSKDEIISDLFVFAFAGNDTTAITLTFILGEMAAHPEIQGWIAEEINHYLPDGDSSQWDYGKCLKLRRCWAVIYETLRISHPLGQMMRTTGSARRILHVGDKDLVIPACTTIALNLPGMSTHPRYWGFDSLIWNPKRFISNTNTNLGRTSPASLDTETLPPDTTTSFFPWSFGKQVCPGKRFSQVELVAVLAALFRSHRLEIVPEDGESGKEARKRVQRLAEDVELRLLNEMREPEKIGMKWARRSSTSAKTANTPELDLSYVVPEF